MNILLATLDIKTYTNLIKIDTYKHNRFPQIIIIKKCKGNKKIQKICVAFTTILIFVVRFVLKI